MWALVVLLAVLLSACGEKAPTDIGALELDDDARIVHITMTDFAFEPAVIDVTAGEKVQLVLHNEGRTVHDMALFGLGVEVKSPMLSNGEKAVLTFVAERSGRIETFCTVPGHKALGMVGEIAVE